MDPGGGRVELVNAGHPPPVVVGVDGGAAFLPLQANMALGVSDGARYRGQVLPLPTGSALALYTDGLVEIRGHSIDYGLDRLLAACAGVTDVHALCSTVVQQLVPEQRRDDIAIIAARVPPLGDQMRGTWPATRASLASVRTMLRRWLQAQGATPEEVY